MDEAQQLDARRRDAQAQLRTVRHYFLKFLEGYKAEGVAIDAVTVQNETDAEQEGRMPACLWAQEQEMEFVSKVTSGPRCARPG